GRQVQVACDQAKNGSARLAGIEPPKFDDTEVTLDQFKERIAKTVAFLKTLDVKAIDASSDREITFPLGQNRGQMKGCDYLNHFMLPNFYFHLTAGYAVVRNFGVDVGKRDFLGAIPLKRIWTVPEKIPRGTQALGLHADKPGLAIADASPPLDPACDPAIS